MKRSLLTAALLLSSAAFAVAKGGTLYIKSKDTKVLKDAKAGASAVTTLQPGDEVVWNGPSAKDKSFHEVQAKGKKGFVLQINLSPTKPVEESDSTGKPLSKSAFASSAAATKGLTEAGVKYAKESGIKDSEAAAQIIYTEEFNKQKATPEAVAAKAKALGGSK